MQFITIIAAVFATSALAAPNSAKRGDWPAPQPEWNDDNGDWGMSAGGNEEGPYQSSCTCVSNNRENQRLGEAACQDLSDSYPNLYWDGNGCVDADGQGVEYNGFRRACQDASSSGWRVDARCE